MTKIPLEVKKIKIDLKGIYCILTMFFFFIIFRSTEAQFDNCINIKKTKQKVVGSCYQVRGVRAFQAVLVVPLNSQIPLLHVIGNVVVSSSF
jgi:hypothetical protein